MEEETYTATTRRAPRITRDRNSARFSASIRKIVTAENRFSRVRFYYARQIKSLSLLPSHVPPTSTRGHRCTFLYLDTVTLRVSARFHVSPVISLSRLHLRRPLHSPSFLVLSFFSSAPASSSFLLLRLRFFLFHLQLLHLPPAETRRAAILFPRLLPSCASSSDPARSNNHHRNQ